MVHLSNERIACSTSAGFDVVFSPIPIVLRPPVRKDTKRSVRLTVEQLEDRIVPAPWMVNAATDTGAGNGDMGDLRYCVANAPNGATIQFSLAAGSTIYLNSAIPIAKDLTIDGQIFNISIAGNNGLQNQSRVFTITGGKVEIDNLTLESGMPQANDPQGGAGGAIYDKEGNNLTLYRDDFIGKSASGASSGGAVYADLSTGSVLSANHCYFGNNIASGSGGAIFALNAVSLQNSEFSTNRAGGSGGAVDAEGATLEDAGVTYTNNGSGFDGGAIFTTDTAVANRPTIALDTFTNNFASNNGGAVAYEPPQNASSTFLLTYSTFATNRAMSGGGLFTKVSTTAGAVTSSIYGNLFDGNVTTSGANNVGGGLYAAQITAGTGSAPDSPRCPATDLVFVFLRLAGLRRLFGMFQRLFQRVQPRADGQIQYVARLKDFAFGRAGIALDARDRLHDLTVRRLQRDGELAAGTAGTDVSEHEPFDLDKGTPPREGKSFQGVANVIQRDNG